MCGICIAKHTHTPVHHPSMLPERVWRWRTSTCVCTGAFIRIDEKCKLNQWTHLRTLTDARIHWRTVIASLQNQRSPAQNTMRHMSLIAVRACIDDEPRGFGAHIYWFARAPDCACARDPQECDVRHARCTASPLENTSFLVRCDSEYVRTGGQVRQLRKIMCICARRACMRL